MNRALEMTAVKRTTTTKLYIVTQVILAFWLVLAYDLLEDRRIDDDSARFNFFLILNLNQSQFFAIHNSIQFFLNRQSLLYLLQFDIWEVH